MATAPVKPHPPLHNFPLSSLKWGQNHHPHHWTTASTDLESETIPDSPPPSPPRVGSRSARLHRISFTAAAGNQEQQPEGGGGEEEATENSVRPWKLRPRKTNLNEQKDSTNETNNNNNSSLVVVAKKRRKKEEEEEESSKLVITLSREEIEEDVFVLTGSRPSRRPKKRPKNLQKVLDSVFPGLWLVGATADSFRLVEAQVKGEDSLGGKFMIISVNFDSIGQIFLQGCYHLCGYNSWFVPFTRQVTNTA